MTTLQTLEAKPSSSGASEVVSFFAGQTVFITGGTGFLGKVLIYKLLRHCPDIAAIYVLIRHKRGCNSRQRLTTLLSNVIFDEVRRHHPHQLDKMHAVQGDIAEPRLGISDEDWLTLVNNVTVIFNSAATVKFDEDLTESVKKNVVSTRSMLQLARQIKHRTSSEQAPSRTSSSAVSSSGNELQAVVHVSTAYVQCHLASDVFIQEKIVDSAVISLDDYERKTAGMQPSEINSREVTRRLVRPRPNTYTMTKAMAEKLIKSECDRRHEPAIDASTTSESTSEDRSLPLCIVRPSIVVASLSEPMTGWVDNLNGPSGIIGCMGHGLLGTMRAYRHIKPDFVPVDMVINLMMSAACHMGRLSSKPRDVDHNRKDGEDEDGAEDSTIPVYNCTSSQLNPQYWRQVEADVHRWTTEYPMENMLWIPHGRLTQFWLADKVLRVLLHWLPAYVCDFAVTANSCATRLLKIGQRNSCSLTQAPKESVATKAGEQPKKRVLSVVEMFTRMTNSINALQFFTTHEFKWKVDRVLQLEAKLSVADKKLFGFVEPIKSIDWSEFMRHYVLGTRFHVFGYSPDSVDDQRRKLQLLQAKDTMLRTLLTAVAIILFSTLILRTLAAF